MATENKTTAPVAPAAKPFPITHEGVTKEQIEQRKQAPHNYSGLDKDGKPLVTPKK